METISTESATNPPDISAVNLSILKRVLIPDLEIRNLKSFRTYHVFSKMEGFWIDQNPNLLRALVSISSTSGRVTTKSVPDSATLSLKKWMTK